MTRVAFLLALIACGDNLESPGPPTFTKHTLDTAFRAEGAALLDVDRDGVMD